MHNETDELYLQLYELEVRRTIVETVMELAQNRLLNRQLLLGQE